MGLFTNPCVNRACRARVRKGSRYCPKCGTEAPQATTFCGNCRSEVALTSVFCWNCRANLDEVGRPMVLDDRWSRNPTDVAVRLRDQDLARNKPIEIEDGTRALLLREGAFVGELAAGRHDLRTIGERVPGLGSDRSVDVILADAGDIILDVENAGLRTSDPFEVGSTMRLVVRIAEPRQLALNLFKHRNKVTLDDLEQQLAGEVQMLVSSIVSQYSAGQLADAANLRDSIEQQLRDSLSTTLSRLGLELLQLRFVGLCGEAWEELTQRRQELAQREAEADLGEQRARLNQRLRQTLTQDKMDAFKDQKDLEQFIRQTEHEIGLKAVVGDDELIRLTRRFEVERDRQALLDRLEIAGIENEDRREQRWSQLLADEKEADERQTRQLRRKLEQAGSDVQMTEYRLQIGRLEHEQTLRQDDERFIVSLRHRQAEASQDDVEARAGIERLRMMKEIEQAEAAHEVELEATRLEHRSRATAEALMSILDGPAAQRVAELEKLRVTQNLTPEQILAMAAQGSPAAAQALAQKYAADGQVNEQAHQRLEAELTRQQQQSTDHADRLERVMKTFVEQMGEVARTRAEAPQPGSTIVTGGGGNPTIIQPNA